jgi:hypothetical protein
MIGRRTNGGREATKRERVTPIKGGEVRKRLGKRA